LRYLLINILIFGIVVTSSYSQKFIDNSLDYLPKLSISRDLKSSERLYFYKDNYDLMENNENMNFGKRFLYSQKILWPSSIAGHIGLYIMSTEPVSWDMFRFQTVKESFTKAPIVERDPWVYNYMVHPIKGSFSYLAYRNKGGSFWESVLGTAINSVIYEYIIASSTQRPSAIDLTVTPIGGALLGEGIYQLKNQFTRDKYLSIFEKIIISIIDPFDVIYNGFNYQRMIK